MKKYQVTGKALALNAGVIELTAEQAKVRMHALKQVKGDVYEITGPVQFKIGEKIGYEGDLPKVLADQLRTPEEIRAEEAGAARIAEEAQGNLRLEIVKTVQADLVRTLQERVTRAQQNVDKARAAFETEKTPARRHQLERDALIADGRLGEATDILNAVSQ